MFFLAISVCYYRCDVALAIEGEIPNNRILNLLVLKFLHTLKILRANYILYVLLITSILINVSVQLSVRRSAAQFQLWNIPVYRTRVRRGLESKPAFGKKEYYRTEKSRKEEALSARFVFCRIVRFQKICAHGGE